MQTILPDRRRRLSYCACAAFEQDGQRARCMQWAGAEQDGQRAMGNELGRMGSERLCKRVYRLPFRRQVELLCSLWAVWAARPLATRFRHATAQLSTPVPLIILGIGCPKSRPKLHFQVLANLWVCVLLPIR